MSRLLTCPACDRRYAVAEGRIGPAGRDVRCQSCGHKWFAPGGGVQVSSDPHVLELADLEADTDALGLAISDGDGSGEAAPRAPGAAARFRAQRRQQAVSMRRRTVRRIWFAAACLLVLGGVGLFAFRQAFVNAHSEAANLYAALGLEVRAGGLGLDAPTVRQARIDGRDYLVVSGRVRNLGPAPARFPLVELALGGPGGVELARWSVDPGEAPVLPGESREWTTEYPDPPVDATTLFWGFER